MRYQITKKKQLNFEIKIFNKQKTIKIRYLINIKILTKNFININFAKYYKLLLITLTKSFKLRLTNKILTENIIYIVRTILVFEKYQKKNYLIIFLTKFDIIFNIF